MHLFEKRVLMQPKKYVKHNHDLFPQEDLHFKPVVNETITEKLKSGIKPNKVVCILLVLYYSNIFFSTKNL